MSRMMPEAARYAARERQYPNRIAEEATIASIDEQAFNGARVYERALIAQADILSERHTDALTDAADLRDELKVLNAEVDRKRVPMDDLTARRWQVLTQRAEATQSDLARINSEMEGIAARLDDPWAAYEQMLNRFPALLPHFQF